MALRDKFAPGGTHLAESGPFRSLEGASSEFAIYPQTGDPLTTYDFVYAGRELEKVSTGGQRLIVRLTGRVAPMDVTLQYETEPLRPWMRKTVRITPQRPEGREFLVSRIDVERFAYLTSAAEGGGIGQPLFVRNHFFGLEHPEGHNDYAGGVITLTNYPGVDVGNGLESKTAVWGVAPDGRARQEFLNLYMPFFALHVPSMPFVSFSEAWNCGYSCSEALTKESIASLKETLVDRYGLKIDSYGNFGNWQDWQGIWQPNQKLFPRGFDPVERVAEAAGMRLGLWFSLTGGNLDTHWGLAHGLEAVRADEVEGPYCIAGPKYRSALKDSLRHYLLNNHINFLWCDYNTFSCRRPGHGHPTEALAALEAAVDGYIDVLKFAHQTSPDARIEITTGMWLSPWWLGYADWVWLGGSDLDFLDAEGVPTLEAKVRSEPDPATKRNAEISYRDYVMWSDLREHAYTFPTWGLKTHGFYNWVMIGGAPEAEAGVYPEESCCNEEFPFFADHVVTSLLRGISDWNLLLNLRYMTPRKYSYLATGLNWGRRNWDVLSNTEMILGNPSKFQVYGYAHFKKDRGLVAVRNPAPREQTAEMVLDERNGFWDMSPSLLKAREIYPCTRNLTGSYGRGNVLRVELAPYETKVLELASAPPAHQESELSVGRCTEAITEIREK